ncbi:DUF6781 family protein [Hydrogenimonas cancrithermarum]|uniref:Cell surface protein n=1 Tax=Hydrogenimonas cancrithermarum TaxID=2993563 RepID=A0ABN6WVM8_9BACT|nr:DUF6781 family protein [Hydrogenimonas cancrithermarum]BDY13047.1 hypothetical protein HCR_13590 [Hydrogenimonas cancrithermarum]
MELEIRAYCDKALASGQEKDKAIKEGIKKAIEAAVHLHPGMSAQNLSEQIAAALYEELAALEKTDEALLQYAFEILIDTVQKPKEKEIEHLIIEIDRLRRHLSTEEEELQRSLRGLFIGIERAAEKLEPSKRRQWEEALENTELEHVEGLGILNETVEAALIAALEEAEEIESAIREVIRQITHKALSEGLLSAARVHAILTTILMKASELAEATPTKAKEIIHGTVYGINDALITTVKQLKEQLNFAPEEIKAGHIVNWEELIKMLSRSDELYKEIIDDVAAKSTPFIREILNESAGVVGDQFAELKRISNETIEVAKKKLTLLAKEAATKGAELKEQLTNEAKKLGTKAWKKAVEMAEAYKNRIEK